MRPLHRLSWAVALSATIAFNALPAGAQTTKTEQVQGDSGTFSSDYSGTKTTTTTADGRTTTTDTKEAATDHRGHRLEKSERVVTVTDADNNPVSEVRTTSETIFESATSTSIEETRTEIAVKKFNPTGGYSLTYDSTASALASHPGSKPSKTHAEEQRDAANNRVSATTTTTWIDPDPNQPLTTVKLHWNAETKTWVIDQGVSFTPAQPESNTISSPNEQVVVPPVSGPSAQIMATYRDPDHPNHSPVYVAERKQDGSMSYLHGVTDGEHHVFLTIPADAVAVSVFKGFDGSGHPDARAATCTVSSDATVPGTQRLPGAPAAPEQPAIVGANTAYDLHAGTITVQTQHTSYFDELALDGGSTRLTTLAVSNRSIVAESPDGSRLGRHLLTLRSNSPSGSGTAPRQAVPIDLVTLVAEPMARVENVGDTATPTIRVIGLPAGDTAVMDFAIGGSAELMQGGTTTTVPVVGNVATCTIRGVRQGEALVRFHLRVVNLAGVTT